MRDNNNFLFIKLCCIGDILFLTPAIRSVRIQYPHAKITILASTWIKEIVERIPSVDEVIYFDAPFKKGSSLSRAIETFRMVLTLSAGNFSCAVIGHRSSFFSLLVFLAGIPRRIGFSGTRFLTDSVFFDETKHETERYRMLTDMLSGSSRATVMELSARESDRTYAEQFLRAHSSMNGIRYIGIFPGGGDNPGTKMHIKRWHGIRYAELIRRLYAEFSLVPVFIGSGSDTEVVTPIIASIEGKVPYVNAVNAPTLGQLSGILSHCSIVVGGDSGPIHMAAALGISTVTIFGPSDPRLVAPIGADHRYIWKQIECSPCYTPATVKDKRHFRGNEFICFTHTHACINDISVGDVYQNISELLRQNRSKGNE